MTSESSETRHEDGHSMADSTRIGTDYEKGHGHPDPEGFEDTEPQVLALEREPPSSIRELERTTSKTSAILAHAITGHSQYKELPTMGGGKDYPPLMGDREPYNVEFDGPKDPRMPVNWTLREKLINSIPSALQALTSTWTSAICAPAIPAVSEYFHVGEVPATLMISLYVFGFAFGPILWGPMSEIWGRKLPSLIAVFLFTCFTFACAVAKDVQTLMICRFFAGACGSAPLVITAATFSDMYSLKQRGIAVIVFGATVIDGPLLAPVVGGYITNSYLHWRWTFYISGIIGAMTTAIVALVQRETYGPVLLVNKARELRKRTGNWAIYAQHETVEFNIGDVADRTILKPLKMLMVEPILFLVSIYHGYIYGLLYLQLEAIPIIFSGYGWKGGNLMLPYIALFVGCMASVLVKIFIFEPIFQKQLARSKKGVLPEGRLPPMMMGAFFFSIGIFWMCWTGAYAKHVHWLAPIFGGAVFGFGFFAIFIPIFNYIIDSYLMLAASAMAANAFLRGSMGAAFPLFTAAMFNNLGIQWAGTLIGCLSLLMFPVPFLFYAYGARIRQKSKYAAYMG